MDDIANSVGMKLKGVPTQSEIMAVSLQKLELGPGDTMVDVGCGTGKVTLEAARICRKAYGVDQRHEAVSVAKENVLASGLKNVSIIEGSAKDVIPTLGPLNAAFVGGSKDLKATLSLLTEHVNGRIVVNAVLLSTLNLALETMLDLGIFLEAVQVHISRSYSLAGSIMLRPIDPVYVIVGRCG